MNKDSFIELMDKYLAGTASEPEKRLAEEYLRRLETENASLLSSGEEHAMQKTIWARIKENAGLQTATVVKLPTARTKILRWSITVAAACVLVLIWWRPWQTSLRNDDSLTATVTAGSTVQKIILEDGTLVWIKPNSQLTYPKAFAGNKREITLKGEALFEVAKDALHPFVVRTTSLDVQVLGTSFNVKDVAEKDTAEVAVLTGNVWVAPKNTASADTVLLQPYHKLVLNKKAGNVQKTAFDSGTSYAVGTEYHMNFVNTPLDSITERIGKKFGVVVLTDAPPGKNCTLSGDFTDQSLALTLDNLCKSFQASYLQKRDTITINGVKCQ